MNSLFKMNLLLLTVLLASVPTIYARKSDLNRISPNTQEFVGADDAEGRSLLWLKVKKLKKKQILHCLGLLGGKSSHGRSVHPDAEARFFWPFVQQQSHVHINNGAVAPLTGVGPVPPTGGFYECRSLLNGPGLGLHPFLGAIFDRGTASYSAMDTDVAGEGVDDAESGPPNGDVGLRIPDVGYRERVLRRQTNQAIRAFYRLFR